MGRRSRPSRALLRDGRLNPLQEAFLENHGLQCGYCTPGMLLRATEFLRENPAPTRAEAREAIASNLCRCTGYQFIVDSLLDAAARLQAAPDDVTASVWV